MKNIPNPTLFCIAVLFVVNACRKPAVILPQMRGGNSNMQSVIFFGITIDANSTYSFDVSQINQPILDSGSISVYFRNSLVIFDTWYSLPYYSALNGNITSLTISGLRAGSVTIKNGGTTEESADYRFDIAPAN